MDVYSLDPRERASLHYCIRNTDGVYPVHYRLKTNKETTKSQPLLLYFILFLALFFFNCAHFSSGHDTSIEAYRENTVPQTHILLEVQNIH